MSYGAKRTQIEALEKQIQDLRGQLNDARKSQEPEKVKDYEFKSSGGETVLLSSLFGDKSELFVIHNMGRGCAYCTLWADGFNGVIEHLENRAGFVVSSPDKPEVQKDFAQSRNWKFRMVSTLGSSFAEDMGFKVDGQNQPGVSVFVKSGGDILRVSDTSFGPGDDYCQVWSLLDLLPKGANDWSPKFAYPHQT